MAHQIPLSLEDGRAAHAGHPGQTCDAAVALHLCQEAQDSSRVFLVEPRHQSVELSVLRGLCASRVLSAGIACAHPLDLLWLSHAYGGSRPDRTRQATTLFKSSPLLGRAVRFCQQAHLGPANLTEHASETQAAVNALAGADTDQKMKQAFDTLAALVARFNSTPVNEE